MSRTIELWEDNAGNLYWTIEGKVVAIPKNVPHGLGLNDAIDILSDDPQGDWLWEFITPDMFADTPEINLILAVSRSPNTNMFKMQWYGSHTASHNLKGGYAAKDYMLGEN